jgi:GNAT superfamily N-acetyltransferase
MNLKFIKMTGQKHTAELVAMMAALYTEDPSTYPIDPARFGGTIRFLLANPQRGCIVVFKQGQLLQGYALLIPFWSNELGGTLLFVDELFVVPAARNRGIAHRLFEFLEDRPPFNAVFLAVEVSRRNVRARRLYESLGFVARKYTMMTRPQPQPAGRARR